MTASDAVPAMLDAARHADSAHRYQLADAAALPFDDASFDLVMAYNVLMDLDDMQRALHEARRVRKADGLLLISLVHPFRDRGGFAGPPPDHADTDQPRQWARMPPFPWIKARPVR